MECKGAGRGLGWGEGREGVRIKKKKQQYDVIWRATISQCTLPGQHERT